MTASPILPMNDGKSIPQIGLGVWKISDAAAADAVRAAIGIGYRLIDTAAIYENEAGTGEGVRASGVARDELFVTTKLWNDRQGYDRALATFDETLGRIGLDYVDLYLIHWPRPWADEYVDTWKAFVRLREEGRARSIGVSNFDAEQIERIADATGVLPVLNQVEISPRFQQRELKAFHDSHGIVTQAWSPLGQGKLIEDPTLGAIAAKHGVTNAQVMLRWHVERGHSTIPKSSSPERMRENIDLFGFELDEDDHRAIAAMDRPDGRFGPDPAKFG